MNLKTNEMKTIVFLFCITHLSVNITFGQLLKGTELYLEQNSDSPKQFNTLISKDTTIVKMWFWIHNQNSKPKKNINIDDLYEAWGEFERILLLNDITTDDFCCSTNEKENGDSTKIFLFHPDGIIEGYRNSKMGKTDMYGFIMHKGPWEVIIAGHPKGVCVHINTVDSEIAHQLAKEHSELIVSK